MYCRECGKEVAELTEVCPHCGAEIMKPSIIYTKPQSSSWNAGKTVAVLLGGFLLFVGIPILFGGGALMGVTSFLNQGGGYIGIEGIDVTTGTQALVARELDIGDIIIDDVDRSPPRWLWDPDIEDFVSFRVKAESNDGKPVFIGIIPQHEAFNYLGSAEYDQLTQFVMEDLTRRRPYIEYRHHQGEEITVSPTDLDIWVAESNGIGTQTLTWSPKPGEYWLVIMNSDASPGVNVELGISVKIPILVKIAQGLFLGGLALAGLGVAVIYFGVINPR
jgi:hypothetical protein